MREAETSMTEEKIVIKTKHGELTLDQLAEVQPGLGRLMKEIGERYHVIYYAAKGGNWMLAAYQLSQVTNHMKIGSTLRPKFSEDLNTFIKEYLNPIMDSIKARDWNRFEEAYKKGIEGSNHFHQKYGYAHIRYVLPKNPPEFYDLTHHE